MCSLPRLVSLVLLKVTYPHGRATSQPEGVTKPWVLLPRHVSARLGVRLRLEDVAGPPQSRIGTTWGHPLYQPTYSIINKHDVYMRYVFTVYRRSMK